MRKLALLSFLFLTPLNISQAQNVPSPIRVNTELSGTLFQLEGPHFTVIAASSSRAAGEEILAAAERVRPEVIKLVGSAPERTYILVDSNTDAFNGFATPQPFPIIRAYVAFPGAYQIGLDWPDGWEHLISHEYAHIAQLGQSNSFQKGVKSIFGSVSLPGLTQARTPPAWLLEGIAVWVESRVSGAGRLQDPYSQLVVSRAALEDAFPSLSDVSVNIFNSFPFGNARYLYGGRFVDYLVNTYGEAKFRQLLTNYNNASFITPFTDAWKGVSGKSLEEDWEGFRKAEVARGKIQAAAPTPSADTRGSYSPLAWNGKTLAWWGNSKLNIADYVGGKLSNTRAVALEARPLSMAWNGNTLLYTRYRENINGRIGEIYALEGGREKRLTTGAHARLLAVDAGKIYFGRENDCFPFVPPQDGCNSSVMELGSSEDSPARGARPGSPFRKVLEFEREHIVSLDVQDDTFLVGRWISGGGKIYSSFQGGFEAKLNLPPDALEASFSDEGEVLYTSATNSAGVPLTYQYGNATPLVNVGGGSFSGQHSAGTFVYLNLGAGGFAPVVQTLELDPLFLAQSATQEAVQRRQTSVYLQPTRIALTLSGNWKPYAPQPRFWGFVPWSGQGYGITAYGADVSQNLSFAGSAFYNPTSGNVGAAGQFRWQLERSQALSVYGNTEVGLGVKFEQILDTPLEAPLTLTPEVAYNGDLFLALGAKLEDLKRDDWGYADDGWRVNTQLSSAGITYGGIFSKNSFTVAGAGKDLDYAVLEGNYHLKFPLEWRISDGFLSAERLSILPTVGFLKVGDSSSFYGGSGLYLDGNLNYLLPYRLGLDVLVDTRGEVGLRFGSSFALPF